MGGKALSDIDASPDRRAVASFQEGFRGEVILPNHPEYGGARIVWNGMVDRRPAMVVRPAGTEDVIAAVGFARELDLVIAVRSGGHSVGGFSTCDGGMVIDLSGMRGVTIDPERRVATVNGGALLRELDEAAQEHGLACPVGVVGHTGVAGLSLGGGMGRLQRKYGFTVDNLLGVELVTAEGRVIRVSDEENAELFWGLRDAGPNFGIVTSFEFALHPLGTSITQGWVAHPVERIHEVAARYGELAAAAPDELFLSLNLSIAGTDDPWPELVGRPVVRLGVAHCGPVEDAERNLGPIRAHHPLADTIERRSYLDVQIMNDEAMAWGKRFYMKGGYTDALDAGLVEACVDSLTGAPPGSEIGFWAQGGATARVPDEAMAFTGRDAAFWIAAETMWEDPADDDAHIGWGRAAWEGVTPFTAAGHYVNDMVEAGDKIARAVYGDAKYERLVGLKRVYDPDNVFRLNQNIRP